jgi:hypothetical protein
MASTGRTEHTSTPPSQANFQSIISALVDYANLTGIDLSKQPFSEKLQVSRSPDDILGLLEEREKAFKEYREGNQRIISCLSPVVRVIHTFSGILGEAVSLVSHDSSCCFSLCNCSIPTLTGPVSPSKSYLCRT